MKKNKGILIVFTLINFLLGCQSDGVYKVRGCGFSLHLPTTIVMKKNDGNMDAVEYDIYDSNKNHLFLIGVLNAPTTLNYFDLYEKKLTKEFKLIGSFVDEYNEMGLGENMVTMIYGSNMNNFPVYFRIIYSPDTISTYKISKILSTLSVEKDSVSSDLCQ